MPLPRRLFREPLLIFGVLAGLVFAGERCLRRPGADPSRIEIPAGQRETLRASLRSKLGREPTPAEFDAVFERWKLDEIAYREGLKLDLGRSGAARELVATAYKERLLARATVTSPSDAEIDRYLAEHRDAYVEPVRYDFDTIASDAGSSEEAAWRVFDDLVKAPEPVSLPPGAVRHTRQSFKEVAQAFGVPFAHALDAAIPHRFQLVDSTRGFLVLRLQQKTGSTVPTRETLRPRLLEAMTSDRRRAAAESSLRELAKSYEIREE